MPRRLWSEVRDDIEERYLSEKAGTEVPGFDTLAADFGTSTPTVKKALDQLLVEGFMTYRASTGLVFTGLQAGGVPQKGELHQVLEVRLSLEPVAARLAANAIKEGKAKRQDVDAFERAYVKLSDAFAQTIVKEAFQTDRDFHQAMFVLVDNPLLRSIVDRTNVWLKKNVEEVVRSLFDDPDYREETIKQHDAIYEAVRDGDGDAAHGAALRHLDFAHGEIIKRFRRKGK